MKQIFVVPIAFVVLVIAPTTALATNESAYQFGFKTAYSSYRCTVTDDCSPLVNDAFNSVCSGPSITNSTACIDGYLHGWKSWCSLDTKVCLSDVLSGTFPDINKVLNPNPPLSNSTFAAEATMTG